jgi:hypothetical protein
LEISTVSKSEPSAVALTMARAWALMKGAVWALSLASTMAWAWALVKGAVWALSSVRTKVEVKARG